ncbi:MAG: rod-binding protein [Pseudomonadota bacterium]
MDLPNFSFAGNLDAGPLVRTQPEKTNSTDGPRQSPSSSQLEKAREAAEAFEAMVLSELLSPLMNSVEMPELTGGGGSKAYATMLNEEYAKAIAEAGGVGIADTVMAALIDLQSTTTRHTEGQ